MKRTAKFSRLINTLQALRHRFFAGRLDLKGDTWLLVAFIVLACISLGVFITYAFLFVRASAFAAI
jgi:hypothetical protein